MHTFHICDSPTNTGINFYPNQQFDKARLCLCPLRRAGTVVTTNNTAIRDSSNRIPRFTFHLWCRETSANLNKENGL